MVTLNLHADKSISRRFISEAEVDITPAVLLLTWISFYHVMDK